MFERLETIVVNQAGYYGIPRSLARQRAEKYLKQLRPVGSPQFDRAFPVRRHEAPPHDRARPDARAAAPDIGRATAGVDIEIRRSMWEFLKDINEQGNHHHPDDPLLEEAESLCRNIAIIDGGRIIERDSMANVLRRCRSRPSCST